MPPTLSLVSAHLFSRCMTDRNVDDHMQDAANTETQNFSPGSENYYGTPTPSTKRDRSPTLNRLSCLSPFSLAPSADQDYPRPPSPKRRTPRPSFDSTPGHTPHSTPRPSADSTPRSTSTSKLGKTKSGKVRPKKWQPDEDDLLRQAVKKYGARNWRAISQMVPGRTHTQCLQHWSKVLKPGLIKGNWAKEEDSQLSHLVKSFAPEFTQPDFDLNNSIHDFAYTKSAAQSADWTYISNHINGRTTKQCRERWFHHLDPSLKHGPFDEAEDRLLLEQHAIVGSKWSLIATKIQGRTADAVKIRHITLSRLQAAGRPIRPPLMMHHSSMSNLGTHHGNDRFSAPALLEHQHQNLIHNEQQPANGNNVLNLPDDHPMHEMHMNAYRSNAHAHAHAHPHPHPHAHAHAFSRPAPDVRTDTPRPHGLKTQESWIDELARRLQLPAVAKDLIEAKCASLERDVRRELHPDEREKVAKVISEACKSLPSVLKEEKHEGTTQYEKTKSDMLSLSPTPSPMANGGMKKCNSSSSVHSLLCPSSPLHLAGDSMGIDAILDLGINFDGDAMGMGDGSLLRELQELDNVDLRLSTDTRSHDTMLRPESEEQQESGSNYSAADKGGKNSAIPVTVPIAPTTPRIDDSPCLPGKASSEKGGSDDVGLAMIAEWAKELQIAASASASASGSMV